MRFFGRFGKSKNADPVENSVDIVARDPDAVAVANSGAVPLSSGYEGSDLFTWLTGGLSSAGVAVNERTILSVSAVYACVNLIAGAIATMPLPVYADDNGERKKVTGGTLPELLNEQPNFSMTAAVFWEYMAASLLLKGDAFARIRRGGPLSNYGPEQFEPIHPDNVEVKKINGYPGLIYVVTSEDGATRETLDQFYMLHIPGPGFDGKRGKSQIKHVLSTSAGIALAADQYSASFFKNGAKPDFAIEMAGKPTTEQIEEMRRVWAEKHGGVGKQHLPAILYGGSKVHELTMNAEDAQLIATRQFQVEDICRIFGVPPHMVGHTTNTTSWGSGVENMGIGFAKYTLSRHLVKIEQEINRKSFAGTSLFCEFNTAGLERGDFRSRFSGYRSALGRAGEPAWMTVREIRKLENLPRNERLEQLAEGTNDASKPA